MIQTFESYDSANVMGLTPWHTITGWVGGQKINISSRKPWEANGLINWALACLNFSTELSQSRILSIIKEVSIWEACVLSILLFSLEVTGQNHVAVICLVIADDGHLGLATLVRFSSFSSVCPPFLACLHEWVIVPSFNRWCELTFSRHLSNPRRHRQDSITKNI